MQKASWRTCSRIEELAMKYGRWKLLSLFLISFVSCIVYLHSQSYLKEDHLHYFRRGCSDRRVNRKQDSKLCNLYILKRILLAYSHTWNLQYPWVCCSYCFWKGEHWAFYGFSILPVCLSPPKLPRRKPRPSLWSGPPQLCLMPPESKCMVWSSSAFFSQTSELIQVFIHLFFYSFCFIFFPPEEAVCLLLTKTNFSTLLWNFTLLISFS